MSTDSPAEPRSPEEIRGDYVSVEDGLASVRELFRWSALITVFWGFGLLLEAFNRSMMSENHPAYSFLPKFVIPYADITAWHAGIGAGCVFSLYYLMNYAMDALQPGAGKSYSRTSAWIVLICIGLFGPLCSPILCIIPGYRLLNKQTRFVLSAEYGKIVEATPWISDVNRRKQQGGTPVWVGILVIIIALVITAGVML